MNISSCSSTANPYQAKAYAGFQQKMQDFKGLAAALQSGDVASAQSALTTLQKELQSTRANAQSTSLLDQSTPVGKDFKALQEALQSGDAKAAQGAFATLEKDIHNARKSHGHHHNHRVDENGDANNSGASAAVSPSDATGTISSSETSPTLNVTA